jgi:histidinol-phosphate aminotransferase
LIGLDRNERLAPLPEWFVTILRERLTSSLASIYPSPTALRVELAAALGLPRECVFITPGTDAALRAVHLAYVQPGDTVVRLEPTYAMVPVYAGLFGARDVAVGYDEELRLDSASLLAAIEPGVRLVVIANPNQPTGTLLADGLLEEVIARCEQAGALLVLDEAYHAFCGVTALPLVERTDNLLVLRTFSKAGGLAGLRVGFAAAAPGVIRALANVRSAGEVNALALEAARLLVAHPEVVGDYAVLTEQGRVALERRVRALGVEPLPTRANFVLLRIGAPHDPAAIRDRLRGRGFIVRGPFNTAGLAGCLRVTLGPPALMESFADAFRDVLEQGR